MYPSMLSNIQGYDCVICTIIWFSGVFDQVNGFDLARIISNVGTEKIKYIQN